MRPGSGRLIAAAACLAGFVALALSVSRSTPLTPADIAVEQAIISHRSPGLTTAFHASTTIATLPFVVAAALTGVLMLVRRTRSWVAPTVLARGVSLSALTIALVTIGVGRARPGPDDRNGPAALDFAFPYGDTGNETATPWLATVLVCATLPRSVPRTLALTCAGVLSAGIGLSRVYLGYHWPSDVVGGWALAATITCLASYAFETLRTHSSQAGID